MNKTLYVKKDKIGVWDEAVELINFTTMSSLSEVLTEYLENKIIPKLRIKAKEKARKK